VKLKILIRLLFGVQDKIYRLLSGKSKLKKEKRKISIKPAISWAKLILRFMSVI